jgi:hypothetical protein
MNTQNADSIRSEAIVSMGRNRYQFSSVDSPGQIATVDYPGDEGHQPDLDWQKRADSLEHYERSRFTVQAVS